ncbi:MAG TPA: hypothetical protein VF036_03850 [Actinomycetota bacterium]
MPDLRDAFRIATDHAVPEPGALERQLRHQRRRSARRKAGAFVAVAAVLALIAGVILATRPGTGDDDDRFADPIAPSFPLFTLDIGSGEQAPFSELGILLEHFELSPDGTTLMASQSVKWNAGERRLWTADADGSHISLLMDRDATIGPWFPDETRIAFVGLPLPDDDGVRTLENADTRQVIVLDRSTGQTTVLTDEETDPSDPTVTPDGSTVVYAVSERLDAGAAVGAPDGDEPGAYISDVPPTSWLRAVDVDTRQTRTLATAPRLHLWEPDVSPSGELTWITGRFDYLGFADRSSLHSMRLGGGGERTIISSQTDDSVVWLDTPMWSPDGSLLAYYRDNPEGNSAIWLYDPTTGEHREVEHGWLETWLDGDTLLIS